MLNEAREINTSLSTPSAWQNEIIPSEVIRAFAPASKELEISFIWPKLWSAERHPLMFDWSVEKKNGFMVFFCTLLLLCAFCPTVKQMNGLCPSGLTGKKTGVLQLLALIALPLWRVWKLTIQVGIKYTLSDAKQTTLKPLQWPETLAQIHANGECTRNRQVTVTKNFMSLHFEHKLVSGYLKIGKKKI